MIGMIVWKDWRPVLIWSTGGFDLIDSQCFHTNVVKPTAMTGKAISKTKALKAKPNGLTNINKGVKMDY